MALAKGARAAGAEPAGGARRQAARGGAGLRHPFETRLQDYGIGSPAWSRPTPSIGLSLRPPR